MILWEFRQFLIFRNRSFSVEGDLEDEMRNITRA